MQFQTHQPHYEHLRKKWTQKHREVSDNFFQKHDSSLRHLTLGGLGGLMLLTTPGIASSLPSHYLLAAGANLPDVAKLTAGEDKNRLLAKVLQEMVPSEIRRLDDNEETQISQLLSDELKISVKPQINQISLNRSFGLIGGEQHLYRFPGDSLFKHADSMADWVMYGLAGIAPNLGAWGYFAPSESQMSSEDKLKERYYIAVQTFLIPGFAENFTKYRDFFKFRKMLVVNPDDGAAVVTVIGDVGPAEWTGKHLGGSPEVMHALGLAEGPRKGAVLYFFIDDQDNKVPLGPISVKEL